MQQIALRKFNTQLCAVAFVSELTRMKYNSVWSATSHPKAKAELFTVCLSDLLLTSGGASKGKPEQQGNLNTAL